MKKLLLMASLLVLSVSCADIVDAEIPTNNSNNNSSKITPPAWIQSTWIMKDSPSTGYKFTQNDICQVVNANDICQKSTIEFNSSIGIETKVVQEVSDNEYKISITPGVGVTHNYHFQKISENTIKDVNMSNSVGSTVTLIKQ